MMKKAFALTLAAVISLVSGCASVVTTYDGSGKVTGKCESQGGFLFGAGAVCTGHANPGPDSK